MELWASSRLCEVWQDAKVWCFKVFKNIFLYISRGTVSIKSILQKTISFLGFQVRFCGHLYDTQFDLLCRVMLSFKLHNRNGWTGEDLQAHTGLGLWHSDGTCHPPPGNPYSVMPLNLHSIGKQGLVQDKSCTSVHHPHINSVCRRPEGRRKGISRQNALLRIGQYVQSPTHHSDQIRVENNKTIII